MLGEKETKTLYQDVLKRLGDDKAEVFITVEDEYLTRFANNYIHQNVAERELTLTVKVTQGKRDGMAKTNRLDTGALDELVERARASARTSPENPDHPGLAEPVEYQPVDAFDERTASFTPEERAEGVGEVCRMAKEKGLNAFGAFSTGTTEIVIGNSRGMFAYHVLTSADLQTVVLENGGDASGWAQRSGWRVEDISTAELGAEAVHKTEAGKGPRNIEPGEFIVVLDPYATVDIIDRLNMYGMGALSVQEGRSWMCERIGKQVMSPEVNIWDDGLDPKGMPLPFDFEGVPKKRTELIKGGKVIGPVYDRATAFKDEKTSTGHGLPPFQRNFGGVAINLFMAPGDKTLEEMIHSTERGLYITRFWYTRLVHPTDCGITGMTRDGTYLIEDGKIVYPVKNLRFTQSYVDALAGVEAIGKETQLLSDFGSAFCVPALKLRSFSFTGSTS